MAIDLSECPDCLCWASRRAARKITRAFDRHLRPHGVRITQFTVLVMLMLAGPLTIGELAHKLSIERTTLSRNLAIMEAAAWITTRPGDDARSRLVSVTGKGRAAVAASIAAWRRAQAAVAAAIGPSGIGARRGGRWDDRHLEALPVRRNFCCSAAFRGGDRDELARRAQRNVECADAADDWPQYRSHFCGVVFPAGG